MKLCTEPDCSSNQFGGGYCAYHQYKRRMQSGDLYVRKTKPKPAIPKESKKRKVERVRYSVQIQDFWNESVENNTNFCFFCGKKMFERDNVHHLRGRTGKYYLDRDYWVNCHNLCHAYQYHGFSVDQLMKLEWYDEFMERLRQKDKLTWEKEKNKQIKSEFDFD